MNEYLEIEEDNDNDINDEEENKNHKINFDSNDADINLLKTKKSNKLYNTEIPHPYIKCKNYSNKFFIIKNSNS